MRAGQQVTGGPAAAAAPLALVLICGCLSLREAFGSPVIAAVLRARGTFRRCRRCAGRPDRSTASLEAIPASWR